MRSHPVLGESRSWMRRWRLGLVIGLGVVVCGAMPRAARAQALCAGTSGLTAPGCPYSAHIVAASGSGQQIVMFPVLNLSGSTWTVVPYMSCGTPYLASCSPAPPLTSGTPIVLGPGQMINVVMSLAGGTVLTTPTTILSWLFQIFTYPGGTLVDQVLTPVTMDVVPPPMQVTPVPASVTVVAHTAQVAQFVLKTTAVGANTYTVTPYCTGGESLCGPGSTVTMGNSDSTLVSVPYFSGPPGTTGGVQLVVQSPTSLPSTYGYFVVDTTQAITSNAPASVWVDPVALTKAVGPSAASTTAFVIHNQGTGTTLFTLTVGCPTGTLTGCSAAGTATVAAGAVDTIPVSYTGTATVGASGPLTLTAAAIGPGSTSTGTTIVTVGDTNGIAVDVKTVNPGGAVARDACLTIAAGHEGASECGDVRFVHDFATVRTKGKARAPTLLYNSQFAQPRGRVAATVTLTTIPTTVTATLKVNGVTRATGSWAGSDWVTGVPRHLALDYDAAADATGAYPYTLTITSTTGGVSSSTTVGDTLLVVNRRSSPFGSGWWLAGLETLSYVGGSVYLWVGGDGSARLYRPTSDPHAFVATSLDRPDTLKLSGSTWTRYAEHGVRVEFDAGGRHVRTVSRLNDTTQFFYRPGLQIVDSILVPPVGASARYQLAYTNTATTLSAVTLSVPGITRTTSIADVPSTTLIASFTDPDSKTVSYSYVSGTMRVQSRTNKLGHVSVYTYDAFGKLVEDSVPVASPAAPIVTHYRPQESQGMPGASAVALSALYTRLDGPRSIPDTTVFRLDQYGAPVTVIDALGDSTVVRREDPRFAALATTVRAPTGLVTVATYDARGNVATTTQINPFGDNVNPETRYTWDPRWDYVTTIVQPNQDSVVLQYDASTGNRLWQQDGRGTVSRTTFHYATSGTASGLLASVTSPLGFTDSVAYDWAGNVGQTRTPSGVWRTFAHDALGRLIAVRTPTNAAQTTFEIDSTVYDVMDRPTQTLAIGGTDTARVVHVFDADGQDTLVQRSALPDTAHVGIIMTRAHYDAAGRLVASVGAGGLSNVDSTVYDEAGNAVKTITRNGDTLSMTYDAVNRLTQRIASPRYNPAVTDGTGLFPRFRNFPGGVFSPSNPLLVFPTDTAAFTYDAGGQLLTASNYAAIVERTYYPNGLLATDTQIVRTYPSSPSVLGDTVTHRYGLGYTYDINGRRSTLSVSSNLTDGSSTIPQTYTYEAQSGMLDTITDLTLHTYAFYHDLDSRLTATRFPGAYSTYSYDADGNYIGQYTVGPDTTAPYYYPPPGSLQYEGLTRDVRGKVTKSVSDGEAVPRDTTTMTYSELGYLTSTASNEPYQGVVPGPNSLINVDRVAGESFTLDAMGNIVTAVTSLTETAPGVSYSSASNQTYTYQTPGLYGGTGRLIGRSLVPQTETYAYDSAGNQVRFSFTSTTNGAGITRSYYDALGKLRVVDQRAVKNVLAPFDSAWHYEEYFYDALGRMVLTRSRAWCTGAFVSWVNYGTYSISDNRCHNQ